MNDGYLGARLGVERTHNLPRRTSLTEGDVVLQSVPGRFVYRKVVAIPGVTRVEPHPVIPGGSGRMKADLLVQAATGLAAYVELAMVSSQANAERAILAEYREDLLRKVELYNKASLDPVIIWAVEAASPRVLAERLNDLRARLKPANPTDRPPGLLRGDRLMPNHLFTFVLQIEGQTQNAQWLLSELYRRIAQMRSGTIVMSQRIPAYFEQLPLSELDDIITAAWLMAGHVSINHQCLVEMDVLGAALEFPGGQTRLALHVRDTIRDMGLNNPWEDYASPDSL